MTKTADFDDKMSVEERRHCDDLFMRILEAAEKCYVPNKKRLKEAYDFARQKHAGQKRQGGEPYICHPLHVALILAREIGAESDVLAAALLHDVIEDCNVTRAELAEKFGDPVASAVDAVSQLTESMCGDLEISKDDKDRASDEKLLTEVLEKDEKRGFLIKLADRIHNLRTISAMPPEKQQAKADHTLKILIPVAKELQMFKLVYILEDLCLKINNPEAFHMVKEGYQRLMQENACALEDEDPGDEGFIHYFTRLMTDPNSIWTQNVYSVVFARRHEASIYRHLLQAVGDNIDEIKKVFTKKYIELYNIHFTVKDNVPATPESIFLKFYPSLTRGDWRVTIIGISHAMESGVRCWILEDKYGIRYRLFMNTESGFLKYSHGNTDAGNDDDIRGHMPAFNPEELPEQAVPKIKVFRRNGKADTIDRGATALDFAFHINPMIGICAVNATINHSRVKLPLHTRLSEGDIVEIHSDHDRNHPEQDIPHATIRWVEYLHTASARRILTRWLETHTDRMSAQNIIVYGPTREISDRHDIPIGSTVLDYMILVYGSKAFEGFEAYLNSSKKAAELNRILRYEDLVKVKWDQQAGTMPDISWFGIVKTSAAREKLIEYFITVQTPTS